MSDHPFHNLTVFGELYAHESSRTITQEQLQEAALNSAQMAKNTASVFFMHPVSLCIRVRRGSFIEWVTVFGALSAFLHQYPNIKLGTKDLIKDVGGFCDYLLRHLNKNKILHDTNNTISLKRKKTPGQIIKFIQLLEKIEKQWKNINDSERARLLILLKEEYHKTKSQIRDPESLIMLNTYFSDTRFSEPFLHFKESEQAEKIGYPRLKFPIGDHKLVEDGTDSITKLIELDATFDPYEITFEKLIHNPDIETHIIIEKDKSEPS